MLNSGTFRADFVGFEQNTSFPNTGQGPALDGTGFESLTFASFDAAAAIDTGISDTLAAQDLTFSGLSTTGVVDDGDLSDDFVVFILDHSSGTAGAPGNQGFSDTFTLAAVPEPSSVALLGLGGLALILRRRK